MSDKQRHVRIYIDGGSRGNPGPAAAGVVIRCAETGDILHRGGIYLGRATNNVAEYSGLLEGLTKAVSLGARRVEVVSDSELLVRQMTGRYRVKNEGLLPLYRQASELRQQFDECTFRHVRREENVEADHLVNRALDQRQNVE